MSAAGDLYQEVIIDHSRSPRNYRRLEAPSRVARGNNPLCGDSCTVYVRLESDIVQDVAFEGQGCAISKASASLMTTAVKGKTRNEAEAVFEGFHLMVKGKLADVEPLGKLAVFAGVSAYPARVKCAILAWHALHAALDPHAETVTTEK